MKTIELITLDENENTIDSREFDTIKEAKEHAKHITNSKTGPAYWDRRAEVEGYHEQIQTVRLMIDGECHSDWFPSFFKSSKTPEAYETQYPRCPLLKNHFIMHTPVISTSHISKEDGRVLEEHGTDISAVIGTLCDGDGHLLCISQIDYQNDLEEFTPQFHQLIQTFVELGYDYIRLDNAGDTVAGIPTFTW